MHDYLTTKQAAEQLGLTQDAVQAACRRRHLKCIKLGRDYLIHPTDLDAYVTGHPDWYANRWTRNKDKEQTT